jgi:hypothetical protein
MHEALLHNRHLGSMGEPWRDVAADATRSAQLQIAFSRLHADISGRQFSIFFAALVA